MQCSAGRSLFFIKPCRTDRTDGRWTNCNTNRWDYGERGGKKMCLWCDLTWDVWMCWTETGRCHSYLHNSRLWLWSGRCYVLVDTLAWGTRACGRFCCPLFQCTKEWHWHSPDTEGKKGTKLNGVHLFRAFFNLVFVTATESKNVSQPGLLTLWTHCSNWYPDKMIRFTAKWVFTWSLVFWCRTINTVREKKKKKQNKCCKSITMKTVSKIYKIYMFFIKRFMSVCWTPALSASRRNEISTFSTQSVLTVTKTKKRRPKKRPKTTRNTL